MSRTLHHTRRLLGALTALGLAASLGLSSAHADTTIKLMVGFPPGGGTDAIARLLGDKLKDQLGANVIVENKAGAGGQLAAQALKDEGAVKVVAYITHPILSGKAVERISNSALDQLVVTDTIPLTEAAQKCGRIRQLSVAGLLGETIRRIRDEESVSSLYVD